MTRQTILIIDDAPDHRDILVRFLRATGYHVVEAEPGPDTLRLAEQLRPDLILVNLSLPGQPGWETARHLRANEPLVHVPVLGATLFPSIHSRRRVTAIGCTERCEKPFDLDTLLQQVQRLLPATA